MKYKLTKQAWEEIGKKAGWMGVGEEMEGLMASQEAVENVHRGLMDVIKDKISSGIFGVKNLKELSESLYKLLFRSAEAPATIIASSKKCDKGS